MAAITLSSRHHAREVPEADSFCLRASFSLRHGGRRWEKYSIVQRMRGTEERKNIIDVNAFSWLSLNQSTLCIVDIIHRTPGTDNAHVFRGISSRPKHDLAEERERASWEVIDDHGKRMMWF